MENIKYNFNSGWLSLPIEDLLNEAIVYKNKIIVKYKYKDFIDSNYNSLFNGQKIIIKVLLILLEGNKDIPNIYDQPYNILGKGII